MYPRAEPTTSYICNVLQKYSSMMVDATFITGSRDITHNIRGDVNNKLLNVCFTSSLIYMYCSGNDGWI